MPLTFIDYCAAIGLGGDMILDAAAARALFAIIITSTSGVDELRPQLPLQIVDRGDSWLVKGTPFTDTALKTRFRMSYMIFRKDTAQVIGILSQGRMMITDAEAAHWHTIMTPEQFEGVFGPPRYFEPNGIHEIYRALYGGLINKAPDAIDYAFVLMQTKPALAVIPKTAIRAEERNRVWHITVQPPDSHDARAILSFSRTDGKLVSGDL